MFAVLTLVVSTIASRFSRTLSLIVNTIIVFIVLVLEGQSVYQFAHWLNYSTQYEEELVKVIEVPKVDDFYNTTKIKIQDMNGNKYTISYYEISKYTNNAKDKYVRLNNDLVVYRNKHNKFICYSEYMKASESRDNLKKNIINLLSIVVYAWQWVTYINRRGVPKKRKDKGYSDEDDEIIFLEEDDLDTLEEDEDSSTEEDDEIIF